MQNPSQKPATQIEPSLLIGPITQLLPMAGLPLKGPLEDKDLAPLVASRHCHWRFRPIGDCRLQQPLFAAQTSHRK